MPARCVVLPRQARPIALLRRLPSACASSPGLAHTPFRVSLFQCELLTKDLSTTIKNKVKGA